MSPEETTNLLTERCREIAASGWQDYLPSPDGDDPEDEPLAVINLVGQDGNYYGAILVVASGGPHIEINTRDAAVYGRWGASETKDNLSMASNYRLATYWQTVYQNAND